MDVSEIRERRGQSGVTDPLAHFTKCTVTISMMSRVRSAVSNGIPSESNNFVPGKHTLGVSEKRTCYKYIQSRQKSALEFSSPDVARDLIKSKNGVDVYESRLIWQDIRSVTRIQGTVKDVMSLLCADDTQHFASNQQEILGDEFIGARVLDTCLSDAKNDSSHYHCALKWLAIRSDLENGQQSFFDMVFLDYTDVCKTADNMWMGFRVVESIRVKGCPPVQGYHRASIRSEVYVVTDTTTRGVVEVTYAAHMDWKLPGRQKLDGLADAVIQRMSNIQQHCENQRLRKIEIMDPDDWVRDAARTKCAVCDLGFHFILRTRHHCRMCGEVICRKCNTKVDIPTGIRNKQLRIRVCVHCLVRCRETQSELQERPSAQPVTRDRTLEQTFLCPDDNPDNPIYPDGVMDGGIHRIRMENLPPIWFEQVPDVDYYAALNVPRDSSTDEIRRSFFALSREFHPDKTKFTEEANQQYPRLDRAYKVLSSRPLRLAYDQYGERGVNALEEDKSDDWTVANYAHQDEYVQERLRVLLRRWYEKQIEAQFPSNTECEVEIDASDFVKHPTYSLKQLFNKQFRMVGISQMVMRQSTSMHVSRNTTLVVGGYLYDKHGLGVGALTCGINYVTADPAALRIHFNSEVGWTPKVSVHLEQPVSTLTSCFLMPEMSVDGLDITVGVHHIMKLLPHLPLQGSMMLSVNNGLTSSLQFHTESYLARTSIAIRERGPQLGVSLRKQLANDSSAKISMDLGIAGAAVTLGTTGKVSRRSRLSMGLRFALQGISVRFGFARGNIRFVVPVVVAPLSSSNAWNTLLAATTPFLVAAIVRQVVKPAQKRKQQEAVQSAHARRVSYLLEARRCALSQQKLMEKQASKPSEVEKAITILVGRYGQHPSTAQDGIPSAIEEINFDVTIPLRFFLQDGRLHLAGTSKAGLLGFYDPCAGLYDPADPNHPSQPRLYIRYAFDGQVYEATFGDLQAVSLPSVHAQHMGAVGQII